MNKKQKSSSTKLIMARSKVAVAILLLCLGGLIYKLARLQLLESEQYRNAATAQYTHEITIQAHRGNIYDRNMKVIARSVTVQTVFISPYHIKDNAQALLIANGLSEILGVEKDDILGKSEKKSSQYQIIKKNVEEEEELLVRAFITKNGLTNQVSLEESTKREYPYGNFAAQVLGFTGSDNNGLNGIELMYDTILEGINGRAVKGRDSLMNELAFPYETYIDAKDGEDVVLTIDWTIQSIMEKYIEQGYIENLPTYGIRAIMMEVDTGEILGMVSYGGYDPNNRNTLSGPYLELYNAFTGTEEEKQKYKTKLLYEMWKNKAATELYDPGSTFKIITTSMGIEEGAFSLDSHFTCNGIYSVLGVPIRCHSGKHHGDQTVAEALVNSCNPAFVQMGLQIGGDVFSKYFSEFGYTAKTGSDVLGEAQSIFYSNLTNQLTLANCAFGQSMSVTPLQHIRGVTAIANGGYLVTPHLLKATVDRDGNVVTSTAYSEKKQVISEATANAVLNVLVNSTKNAAVSGYNISSKTGTSQKLGRENAEEGLSYYISSCVSFAPAEDPEIAILVIVDEPTGAYYYGSQVAAPIIGNILSEVLPYLDIAPNDSNLIKKLTVSEYRNSDVNTAKYAIEKQGLNCVVKGSGTVVVDQMPRAGAVVSENGVVILYTAESEKESVTLRNFNEMTPEAVLLWCKNNKLNLIMEGIFNREFANCTAVSQSIEKGTRVDAGSIITVTFIYNEEIQ